MNLLLPSTVVTWKSVDRHQLTHTTIKYGNICNVMTELSKNKVDWKSGWCGGTSKNETSDFKDFTSSLYFAKANHSIQDTSNGILHWWCHLEPESEQLIKHKQTNAVHSFYNLNNPGNTSRWKLNKNTFTSTKEQSLIAENKSRLWNGFTNVCHQRPEDWVSNNNNNQTHHVWLPGQS